MLYLLDANVLIDANRDYYPLNRVPEFWAWLVDCGTTQRVKIPLEMYEEVLAGKNDALTNWLKGNRDALLLPEDVNRTVVARVTDLGYAPDLSDEEVERIGRDPFLIAYALSDRARRTVVTTEVSKPSRQRANRHIPDVCDGLGVLHCNTYEFIRVLDFTTGGGDMRLVLEPEQSSIGDALCMNGSWFSQVRRRCRSQTHGSRKRPARPWPSR